jgi:hypothetical protein
MPLLRLNHTNKYPNSPGVASFFEPNPHAILAAGGGDLPVRQQEQEAVAGDGPSLRLV